MDTLTIAPGTPDLPDVNALLLRHHALMRASSPEESCHVMDPAELLEAGVTLLTAHDGDQLLGVGALKALDGTHGELKSMHTAQEARGRGVARALLVALMDRARADGLTRLSLETGTAALFAPARGLYAANGFAPCAPFADYTEDPLSVFMTRAL